MFCPCSSFSSTPIQSLYKYASLLEQTHQMNVAYLRLPEREALYVYSHEIDTVTEKFISFGAICNQGLHDRSSWTAVHFGQWCSQVKRLDHSQTQLNCSLNVKNSRGLNQSFWPFPLQSQVLDYSKLSLPQYNLSIYWYWLYTPIPKILGTTMQSHETGYLWISLLFGSRSLKC